MLARIFFVLVSLSWGVESLLSSPPPLPLLPIPSARQLQFHNRRLSMFFHFGVNTFTNRERGTGHEDPSCFDPKSLNASQWMLAAVAAGAELVILTAKHHDGFCLWPSRYTNFSVASSPWRGGKGDLVGEFVTAARHFGLEVGLYLSPWDMHEACYGQSLEYNEFYLGQLRELLTGYGPISEVWLDGAKGANAPDMDYWFKTWFATIHQLQPNANIFSDAGPDVRWVGNEYAEAGSTCWATANQSSIVIGGDNSSYLETGDPNGSDWLPAECDVSIRAGWFWHSDESPKSLQQLLRLYYKSSGRNCVLLLNVPPNSSGLVENGDIQVLTEFRTAIDSTFSTFSTKLAANASVRASSSRGVNVSSSFRPEAVIDGDPTTYWAPKAGEQAGWLEFDLGQTVVFNVVEIKEPVQMGQRVMEYLVQSWDEDNGSWTNVASGTTIGYRKLDAVDDLVESRHIRLVITKSRADPLISSFNLYLDECSSSSLHRAVR